MSPKRTIIDQLRRAIENAVEGRQQSKFAEDSGIDAAIISRFLSDDRDTHRDFSLETAAKLCTHLGLELRPK